ncbi:uncharacterized protein Tco025E_04527 [Trypanosoma conorhini]|uniref:Uncharacterized protein n=1 Tax=Trypanosoma conorhini TaxID=83891 RepID=A0A3R7L2J5_9TRYP|nr:uncharacterized protein Tco025E_04527 [Trypanosoma conorhini]RNF18381.1 hypothetical protein Tco025E_04527 [Trypanosoma conorhini]
MSQTLERLLPALLQHLSGDFMFLAHNHGDDAEAGAGEGDTHDVREEAGEAGRRRRSSHNGAGTGKLLRQQDLEFHPRRAGSAGEPRGRSGVVESPSTSAVPAAAAAAPGGGGGHRRSAQRWRRCVELWRHLLSSDRLFLALLFHSGALWAVEWRPSSAPSSAPDAAAVTGTEAPRSWAKSVMWFLQLHEETATPVKDKSHTSVVSDTGSAVKGCKGEARAASHIHAEDEVLVQRTAMTLLSEWFAMVDCCGKRFARAYYFSSALKIAALVGNMALVEDIPHLHGLVLQEPRSVSQFTAFCSILCCLLVEEARQRRPFRLQLPPPFFLLNFNLIGRGSRIGVWLPRNLTGGRSGAVSHGATAAAAAAADGGGGGGGAACAPEAQFHSCEVCSPGVMLRVPPASPASAPVAAAGDLLLGVRLLDEAYVQVIDVLPVMRHDADAAEAEAAEAAAHAASKPPLSNTTDGRGRQQQEQHAPPEAKRRGRRRRPRALSAAAAVASSPCRCWCAFAPLTQSYVRVDVLHPRPVAAIVPSLSASASAASAAGGPGRRRQGQQLHHPQPQPHEEAPAGTVPLRRSSCVTAQRDPLATIVFALATSARRLMGCRGLFVAPPPPTAAAVHAEDAAPEEEVAAGKGRPAGAVPAAALAVLHTSEEELECLSECAIHLLLEALLLCRALSSDVVPQLDAWAMEVASNAVDLALAAPEPVLRHLHAVGLVLSLVPHPHQSLLITVGLFATLAQRQREGDRSSTNGVGGVACAGWWEVFKACVLKDAVIPGQLCRGTWELVARVERSLRVIPHVRLQSRQPQQKQQQQQQEEQQGQQQDVASTIQAANGEGESQERASAPDGDGVVPRRRLALLHLHSRAEKDRAVKRLKTEPPTTPLWLRAARVVEVGTQPRGSSLQDWAMAMWWSLERAAADAA